MLLRDDNAPLLMTIRRPYPVASVASFSPVTLSAQLRLTSELLRTL